MEPLKQRAARQIHFKNRATPYQTKYKNHCKQMVFTRKFLDRKATTVEPSGQNI